MHCIATQRVHLQYHARIGLYAILHSKPKRKGIAFKYYFGLINYVCTYPFCNNIGLLDYTTVLGSIDLCSSYLCKQTLAFEDINLAYLCGHVFVIPHKNIKICTC
jgi:hypothetical protein